MAVAPTVAQTADNASMITVFAPSNAAINAASSALASLASNQSALQSIILGHVIVGQTLYSNAGPGNLAQSQGVASAAGNQLTFATNVSLKLSMTYSCLGFSRLPAHSSLARA